MCGFWMNYHWHSEGGHTSQTGTQTPDPWLGFYHLASMEWRSYHLDHSPKPKRFGFVERVGISDTSFHWNTQESLFFPSCLNWLLDGNLSLALGIVYVVYVWILNELPLAQWRWPYFPDWDSNPRPLAWLLSHFIARFLYFLFFFCCIDLCKC